MYDPRFQFYLYNMSDLLYYSSLHGCSREVDQQLMTVTSDIVRYPVSTHCKIDDRVYGMAVLEVILHA